LVDLKKKVLLIDNDSQGNLTQAIGASGYDTTIYECITKGISIDKAIIKTDITDLDIVPANINYANAELALANVKDKEFLLKKTLDGALLNYDYVLIDCSPSLSLTTLNALVAADSVLIPLEPSIFNLQGIAQLVKIIKLVTDSLNKNLKIKGVLLTRVDARSHLAKEIKVQLKETFGDKLFDTAIHQNIAIVKSQIAKKPVLSYERLSKGSREYLELAKEVIKRE